MQSLNTVIMCLSWLENRGDSPKVIKSVGQILIDWTYFESKSTMCYSSAGAFIIAVCLHLGDPIFTLFQDLVSLQPEMFLYNFLEAW